eukprot:7975141-Lingulodinium_polyedra.AAC.1
MQYIGEHYGELKEPAPPRKKKGACEDDAPDLEDLVEEHDWVKFFLNFDDDPADAPVKSQESK